MLVRVLVALTIAAVALTGCGRRSSLGTPEAQKTSDDRDVGSGTSPLDPGSSATAEPQADFDPAVSPTPVPEGKRTFVLDPLL